MNVVVHGMDECCGGWDGWMNVVVDGMDECCGGWDG